MKRKGMCRSRLYAVVKLGKVLVQVKEIALAAGMWLVRRCGSCARWLMLGSHVHKTCDSLLVKLTDRAYSHQNYFILECRVINCVHILGTKGCTYMAPLIEARQQLRILRHDALELRRVVTQRLQNSRRDLLCRDLVRVLPLLEARIADEACNLAVVCTRISPLFPCLGEQRRTGA